MNHIFRTETTHSGKLRVVQSSARNLCKAIRQQTDGLFATAYGEEETLRVATASVAPNASGYEATGANAIFYEAPLERRALTAGEEEWCAGTHRYSGDRRPDELVEVVLPSVDQLEQAIFQEDLSAYDELDAIIEDHTRRDKIVRSLQTSIETEQFRAARLNPRHGVAKELLPEWDPESSDKSPEMLYEMASMRADAHQSDWTEIVGFPYYVFFEARTYILDVIHPQGRVEPYEAIALDVADGADGWEHCMYCSGVWPENDLLSVPVGTRNSSSIQVCDGCAERSADFDAHAVDEAKDRRARRNGGQRRLEGFDDTDK